MRIFLFLSICLLTINLNAQNTIVTGSIIDVNTGEPLIGASVIYGKGKGVVHHQSELFT